MSTNRTNATLDWKIWVVAFGVVAVGIAVFLKDDVEEATAVELGTDEVDQSVNSHTQKNRQASDVLGSIVSQGK